MRKRILAGALMGFIGLLWITGPAEADRRRRTLDRAVNSGWNDGWCPMDTVDYLLGPTFRADGPRARITFSANAIGGQGLDNVFVMPRDAILDPAYLTDDPTCGKAQIFAMTAPSPPAAFYEILDSDANGWQLANAYFGGGSAPRPPFGVGGVGGGAIYFEPFGQASIEVSGLVPGQEYVVGGWWYVVPPLQETEGLDIEWNSLDPAALYLSGDGRFKVRATWRIPNGDSGQATAVAMTDDTGLFWFFKARNVEMVVKVLNACVLNQRFWVFAGGLTNVQVDLDVEDTARPERSRHYANSQGNRFPTAPGHQRVHLSVNGRDVVAPPRRRPRSAARRGGGSPWPWRPRWRARRSGRPSWAGDRGGPPRRPGSQGRPRRRGSGGEVRELGGRWLAAARGGFARAGRPADRSAPGPRQLGGGPLSSLRRGAAPWPSSSGPGRSIWPRGRWRNSAPTSSAVSPGWTTSRADGGLPRFAIARCWRCAAARGGRPRWATLSSTSATTSSSQGRYEEAGPLFDGGAGRATPRPAARPTRWTSPTLSSASANCGGCRGEYARRRGFVRQGAPVRRPGSEPRRPDARQDPERPGRGVLRPGRLLQGGGPVQRVAGESRGAFAAGPYPATWPTCHLSLGEMYLLEGDTPAGRGAASAGAGGGRSRDYGTGPFGAGMVPRAAQPALRGRGARRRGDSARRARSRGGARSGGGGPPGGDPEPPATGAPPGRGRRDAAGRGALPAGAAQPGEGLRAPPPGAGGDPHRPGGLPAPRPATGRRPGARGRRSRAVDLRRDSLRSGDRGRGAGPPGATRPAGRRPPTGIPRNSRRASNWSSRSVPGRGEARRPASGSSPVFSTSIS